MLLLWSMLDHYREALTMLTKKIHILSSVAEFAQATKNASSQGYPDLAPRGIDDSFEYSDGPASADAPQNISASSVSLVEILDDWDEPVATKLAATLKSVSESC